MDLGVVGQEGDPHDFKPGIIDRLACLPQPLIVAVQGACYTGGLELALTADFIVADATARFADTHGKWGLVATWGVFQRLPRRIGTGPRSEEHTSELQSLMRISYADFC